MSQWNEITVKNNGNMNTVAVKIDVVPLITVILKYNNVRLYITCMYVCV